MDLVIDFGNTNKKLAIFRDGMMVELTIVPDLETATIRDFTEHHPGIENCILASVIHHPKAVTQFLEKHFHFIGLDENTPVPVKNIYRQPGTLGKDRLAAAVSGAALFPGRDVLVINLGSCITFDFIDKNNTYHGGAISPGMQMRFRALNSFTGKLPLVTYREPVELTGTDTESSVLSGVVHGIINEIEGIAVEYRKTYSGLQVIVSGGDMKYFEKQFDAGMVSVPNIVLRGLYRILIYNLERGNEKR